MGSPSIEHDFLFLIWLCKLSSSRIDHYKCIDSKKFESLQKEYFHLFTVDSLDLLSKRQQDWSLIRSSIDSLLDLVHQSERSKMRKTFAVAKGRKAGLYSRPLNISLSLREQLQEIGEGDSPLAIIGAIEKLIVFKNKHIDLWNR